MKKLFYIALIVIGLLIAGTVYAVNVTVPQSPALGSVLWGNANGTYNSSTTPVKISTSTPFSVVSSTGTSLLTVLANGNVGIGTANSAANLEIAPTAGQVDALKLSKPTDASNDWLAMQQGTIGYRLGMIGSTVDAVSLYKLALYGGASTPTASAPGTRLMVWDYNTGNVGINTSTPAAKLHIQGGNTNDLIVDNDGSQYTEIDIANKGAVKASEYWDNTNSVAVFSLGSSSYNYAFITGNVGINTTTPAAKLSVVGSGTTNPFDVASSSSVSILQVTASSQVLVGAAAQLIIPQGAAPVINTAGQIAIDTTAGQFVWNDGSATNTITSTFDRGFPINSTTPDQYGKSFNTATGTWFAMYPTKSTTISQVSCYTDTGNVSVIVGNGTSSSTPMTCSNTGASTSPASLIINAGQPYIIQVGSATSTANRVTVTTQNKSTPQ